MGTESRTLYEVLDCAETASAAELKRAWRARLLDVHPDHGGSAADTREVQAAYEVLSDERQRCDYDRGLAARRAGSTRGAFDEDPWRQQQGAYAHNARSHGQSTGRASSSSRARNTRPNFSTQTCPALTKRGWPCRGYVRPGQTFCYAHDPNHWGRTGAASGPSRSTRSATSPPPSHEPVFQEPNHAVAGHVIAGVGIAGLVLTGFVALGTLAGGVSTWSDVTWLWFPILVCAGVIALGRGVARLNARIAANARWWRLWRLVWQAIGWVILVAVVGFVVFVIVVVLLYVAFLFLIVSTLTGMVKIAARR